MQIKWEHKFNINFLLFIVEYRNLQAGDTTDTVFLFDFSIDCSLITYLLFLSIYNSFIDKTFTIRQTKFNWACWQSVDGKHKYLQSFTKSSEVWFRINVKMVRFDFSFFFTICLVASSLSLSSFLSHAVCGFIDSRLLLLY